MYQEVICGILASTFHCLINIINKQLKKIMKRAKQFSNHGNMNILKFQDNENNSHLSFGNKIIYDLFNLFE